MRGCAFAISVLVLVGQLLWVLVFGGLVLLYSQCDSEDCAGPSLMLAYAIGIQVVLTPFSLVAIFVALATRED